MGTPDSQQHDALLLKISLMLAIPKKYDMFYITLKNSEVCVSKMLKCLGMAPLSISYAQIIHF